MKFRALICLPATLCLFAVYLIFLTVAFVLQCGWVLARTVKGTAYKNQLSIFEWINGGGK